MCMKQPIRKFLSLLEKYRSHNTHSIGIDDKPAGFVKLFNNSYPSHAIDHIPPADQDNGYHGAKFLSSDFNRVLLAVGNIYEDFKLPKNAGYRAKGLLSRLLPTSHNLMYHADIRLLLLQRSYDKIDLSSFNIHPNELRSVCEHQRLHEDVCYDEKALHNLMPLLEKIHREIFQLISSESFDIFDENRIFQVTDQAAGKILQDVRDQYHQSLHNKELFQRLILGEFISILLGTNLIAFRNSRTTTSQRALQILRRNPYFELDQYDFENINEMEGVKVHLSSPGLTQSPLRDAVFCTPYVPRHTSCLGAFHRIYHFSHPAGLELRSYNSLRGNTSPYALYGVLRFAESGLSEILSLYRENKTQLAYHNMIRTLNANDKNADKIKKAIRNYYLQFWTNQLRYAKDLGFQSVLSMSLGQMNFIADISNMAVVNDIRTIVHETFAQAKRHQYDDGIQDCYIVKYQSGSFISFPSDRTSVEVSGDIFTLPQSFDDNILKLISGDYGQKGGFNNGSTSPDELSVAFGRTLAHLFPYSPKPRER